jgi:nitrate/nitrite transport system permease protein
MRTPDRLDVPNVDAPAPVALALDPGELVVKKRPFRARATVEGDPGLVVVRDDLGVRVEGSEVAAPRRPSRWRDVLAQAGLAVLGAAALVGIWALLARMRPDLPGPVAVASELRVLLARALTDNGPNDKGIFLQLAGSLRKVFTGFALAAAVGIPLGFLLGANRTALRAINPVVQLLRPVSPLAWFPIALVLFKDAQNAGVFTIGITALWPTLINTTAGVASVPQDHRNVARVFRFTRAGYVRHVLLPYSMTAIFTGLRLSMGIAWMVIVATEMLSGGTGIGFFVWDSYNNNNLAAVLSAILFIGMVGLVLDLIFLRLARRFDYTGAAV